MGTYGKTYGDLARFSQFLLCRFGESQSSSGEHRWMKNVTDSNFRQFNFTRDRDVSTEFDDSCLCRSSDAFQNRFVVSLFLAELIAHKPQILPYCTVVAQGFPRQAVQVLLSRSWKIVFKMTLTV